MNLLKKYYFLISGIIIFCVYLTTIAPSIIESDSGELATVQYTLGIAHPTGYPLFAIIGYLFSLIPLPFTPIFQLNLLCTIWTTLAAVVFIITIKLILDNLTNFQKLDKKQEKTYLLGLDFDNKNIEEWVRYFVAITSGFIFAFSRTVWFQSTSVEVYCLNLFLVNLSILYTIKAYLEEEKKCCISKNWFLSIVFFSFALANHRSAFYILPAVLFLYFSKYKITWKSAKGIIVITIIIVAVVIINYLYLPIRASQKPLMNWGDPSNLERITDLFFGKFYSGFMTIETASIFKQIKYFFLSLNVNLSKNELNFNELSFCILFTLVGFVVSIFYLRKVCSFFFIILVTTVILSSFYNIPDIGNYFLPAYTVLAGFSAIGITTFFFIFVQKTAKKLVIVLVIICVFSQGFFNYFKINLNDKYWTSDIATAVLMSVDKNSVIISNVEHVFPAYYLQNVEGIRKDVVFISQRLFRYEWYCEQLRTLHPYEIFKKNNAYEINTKNRSLYITKEVLDLIEKKVFTIPKGSKIIPDFFLYKVVYNDNYQPANIPDFKIRYSRVINADEDALRKDVLFLMLQRYYYELGFKKYGNAQKIIQKIHEIVPDFNLPKEQKEISNQ